MVYVLVLDKRTQDRNVKLIYLHLNIYHRLA